MNRYADGYVQQLLDSMEIDYEEKGAELWAPCPGHYRMVGRSDNHPSWSINRETGAHLCFSCGYKGNLPTLVRDLGGDIRLIDEGTMPVPEGWAVDRSLEPASPDEIGYRMNPAQMAAFRVPIPQDALDFRRIDRASALVYDLGWDSTSDSWIFPFYDPADGSLLGYQSKSTTGRAFRNYPTGISKSNTLFGYRDVSDVGSTVVVVESPLDAVLAYRLGHPAVAVCGSRLSDEQLDLLSTFEFVIIALDNDDAGRKENKRLSRMLLPFRYAVAEYPDGSGKDIGEMTDKEIKEMLR